MRQKIVITTGDPAGCGPLITLKALAEWKKVDSIYLIGDGNVLKQYPFFESVRKKTTFIDVRTPGISRVKKGFPSRLSGKAALTYLEEALRLVSQQKTASLVTAPVSKEAVRENLPSFSGHTEFLARRLGARTVAMMMASGRTRIVLLTRHIPLSQVPRALTGALIRNTAALLYQFLTRTCRIRKPRIAIASLNPHAGTDTFLGKEEKKIVKALRGGKLGIEGPFPADTLFTRERMERYDALIALYHDQGMIPFKLTFFKGGVNCTLGLPVVRTSPAHGPAFDLMRKGILPLHSSMVAAVKMAYKLSNRGGRGR